MKNQIIILMASVAIFITDPVFGMLERDERTTQVSPKFKVVESIRTAVSLYEGCDYKTAQRLFTDVLGYIQKALEGDVNIDVSGKVGKGIFIQHPEGDIEEECYYSDDLPLKKRAASVAHLAADSAEKANNFLA